MKLHLPKLLRNSVLACIAAVASVTTSVGTATYIGGTVAFVMAGQQAVAETTTLTEANATYTYSAGNDVVVNVGDGNYATITINSGENVQIDKTGDSDSTGFISKTSGKVNLDIAGASAVLDSNGGTCFIQGKVSVGSGGSFIVTKNDGTGYGGGQIPEIELNGGSLEIAARQTFQTTLSFKGNGTVKATDNEAFAHETAGNAPSLEFFNNPTVNVSGTGNKIEDSVAFYLRSNVTINLQNGGELVVDSLVGQRAGNGPGSLTVTGTGALTFTNDSLTFNKGINLSGGTLTLGTAASTTTLGGTIAMTGGTLVLNGAVKYEGNLNNLSYTEQAITGTSNGIVDYGVVYHVLTGGTNTGTATTVTYNNQSYSLAEGINATQQAYLIAEGTVNVGGSSAAEGTTSARRFHINEGATMNLYAREAGAAMTADQILLQATGTGTIAVQSDMVLAGYNNGGISSNTKVITGKNTPKFTGTISVQSGTLKLGDPGEANYCFALDLTQIKSLDLDGGNVRAFVADTTIGTVNVKKAGTFNVFQSSLTGVTEANPSGNPGLTINNMALEANVNFTFNWGSVAVIKSLSGTGAFSVNSARDATLIIESVDGVGPISLAGGSLKTTLGVDASSQLKLGGTITTSKLLTVNGSISLTDDLAGFTVVQEGTMGNTLSYNDGQDGYYAMQGTTYLLLDNQATKTEGEGDAAQTVVDLDAVVWNSGLTATLNGATVQLIRDAATGDLTFVSGSSLDTIYHVNTQDITVGGENATANTARATGFAVAEGRKVTMSADLTAASVGDLLLNSTGTGTIVLEGNTIMKGADNGNQNKNTVIANKTVYDFGGVISVASGTLHLGMDGAANNHWSMDLSKLQSIDMDGGGIRVFGTGIVLNKLNINKQSTLQVWQAQSGLAAAGSDEKVVGFTIGELVLSDSLEMNVTWESCININKISGEGDFVVKSDRVTELSIDSVDTTGTISLSGGTLSTVLGKDASSQLKLGGTLTNSKPLTVNGVITISDDLSKFKIVDVGTESDTLSKGTDGYKQLTGATYLLLENTGAATDVTWNAGTTANYGDGTVTLTKDDATSNITFVGGSSWNTIYHVNTADITIGGENASDDTERATGLNVAAGRKVTIAGTVDAGSLLKNTTAAAGSTVVVDSELTAPIYLNADVSNLAGTLDIQGGRVVVGAANINSSGANFAFAPAKLIIGDGGEFTSNFGQNTATTPKELGVAIDAQSGAKLSNVDGHVKYNGAIRFNVEDPAAATASYNNSGEVVYSPYFGKNIEFTGKLEGAGTVVLNNTQCNSAAYDRTVAYKISGAENTFAGTYKLADGASTEATDFIELHLQHANAAKLASVDLASTTAVSKLLLGSSAEIVGLYGSDADNVVQANGANATLTVSKGNYGGQLTNGGDTAVLSLTKKGTETLTLGGSIGYTGDTVVQGGKLNFTGSNALTLGNISLSNGGHISTASALTLSAGAALTMDMTGASTANALIGVGAGQLTLTDATCSVALSNLDDLQDGDYKLISWAAANNALTLDKFNVTGVELGDEYFLKVENNALILTKETAAELVWDATNRSTWAEGEAFAADGSEQVNFETKDVAVFNSMATGATEEAVTIKGSVTAKSVSITPGEGKSYTFTSHADGGQLATTKLEIGAGTVTFGAGSLKIEKGNDANAAFKSVTVAENGVLDLSALNFAAGNNDNEKNAFVDLVKAASGAGTIRISVTGGAAFVKEDVSVKTNLETGDIRLNSWGLDKTLSIAEAGSLTADTLTIESNAHVAVAGGKLNADSIMLGFNATDANGSRQVSLAVSAGEVKTDSIEVTQVGTHKFSMSDGSLEITTADGFKSIKTNASGEVVGNIEVEITGGTLVANTASWEIAGGSIGNAEIVTAGNNTITLTDTKLTGTIDNTAGSLVLSGSVDINPSSSFATQEAGVQYVGETAGNGFKFADVTYTLAANKDNVTLDGTIAWKKDGTALETGKYSYAEGKLTVQGVQDGTLYWSNTGDVTYGTAGISGATGIAMAGGNLELNANLDPTMTAGIVMKSAGTVTVGTGVTLAASQVADATATNKLTLDGSGTYNLGTATSLGDGAELADTWAGTVSTAATSIATDTTLALGNKVEFTAEKVTLSADLSTAGALTMQGLTFGSLDAQLSVGGLLTIGSIGVDTSLLSQTEAGTWDLLTAGSVNSADVTLSNTGMTGVGKDGLYDYKLEWDGTTLKLVGTTNAGYVWADGRDEFGNGEAQEWVGSDAMANSNVAFTGGCDAEHPETSGIVNVDTNGVEVKNITVTTSDDITNPQLEYTFVGGDIESSGKLLVSGGTTLNVENNTTFAEASSVAAGSTVNIQATTTQGSTSSLTVEKDLTVGEAGSQTAAGMTVDDGGSLVVGSSTTAGTADAATLTVEAGSSLTVKDGGSVEVMGTLAAAGTLTLESGASVTAATIKTDTITINKLDSTADSMVLAESVEGWTTATGDVTITLADAVLADIVSGEYNIITYLTSAGSLLLDSAVEQALQQMGYSAELKAAGAATFALSRATTPTTVVLSINTANIIWNVGDTMADKLIVLDGNGKFVSEDILDNVDTVKVAGEKTLSLEGADLTRIKLNDLTATTDDSKLNITGDGASADKVTITKSSYDGVLALSKVTADMEMTGAHVIVQDDVVLNGKLTDGVLQTAAETTVGGGDLKMSNSALRIEVTPGKYTWMSDDTVADIMDKGILGIDGITGIEDEKIEVGTTVDGKFVESEVYNKYFSGMTVKDNKVVAAGRNTSYFSNKLAGATENGKAGLVLADAALVKLNPQQEESSTLGMVLTELESMTSGKAADELGAALAGAGTAVLGMAVSNDVERQLKAIRNRTTTMGVDQSVTNEEMPYFNAWINAEGDHHEMSEDGTLAGYKLSSWGGTVGFDVDMDPTFTAGMALTAMYGDLDANSADKATGELNSYYVTAFARYAPSAWTHTFVGTIGKSDISLERTVAGNKVEGDTNAMSFGLMYETGRVIALTEDGTTCLQPVFNVTWRHTTVDAYRERGGDHGLSVEEQTMDTITFGLGARLQSVVGETMYNRTSVFECRVLAKADAGDRTGTSKVALAGATAEVDSAEVGAVGVEAGMGLTIPVGQEGGSIFMDASIDLRADYINANGTVGYRVNF